MKKYVLSVLAVTVCSGPVLANTVKSYLIGTRGKNKLPYKLSLPSNYAATTNDYPLVIGLHGGSRMGKDLKRVHLTFGSTPVEKVIMMAPQSAKGWTDDASDLMSIVEYEKTQLRIDEDRIFVVGYSMGGHGTYVMLTRYPKVFAGAGPVSSSAWRVDGTWLNLKSISHLPIWAFNGGKDGPEKHRLTVAKGRN